MKVSATTETVRAVTRVFQLAGILDDRVGHADPARIAAWSEQVQRHNLTEPDLLDGLQAFYDSPSERAIQVGDLIHHAQAVRRKRREKERDAELRAIEEAGNSKAAEETRSVLAGMVFGTTPRTDRLNAAEDALQSCKNGTEAKAAIREFFDAKREAKKTARTQPSNYDLALVARQRAAAPPAAMEDK